MPEYILSSGEDLTDALLRIKELDHGAVGQEAFDVLTIWDDGRFVIRHNGVPELLQSGTATSDSATNLQALLPVAATQGSTLLVAVLVDQAGGARTITKPAGYESLGGTTTHGNSRMQLFVKTSTGGEVGSPAVAIGGGSAEMIVIAVELGGFQGAWLEDQEETDTGTGTAVSLVEPTLPDEANNALVLFVGSRLEAHTAPVPTNGYVEQISEVSASMRLTYYGQVVEAVQALDVDVTLDSSVAWIARAVSLTPSIPMLEVDPIAQTVFVRSIELLRIEDEPSTPDAKRSLLYARYDPDNTTKQQPVYKHSGGSGGAAEIPYVREDGPRWFSGVGSPEGVVTAPVASQYSREDGAAGTCLYVKESGVGNTGWVAK